MFGVLIRAGPQALFMALLGAILARILSPLIGFMTAGPATEDDLLINALTAVSENYILMGVLALVITILATAVLESRAGAVR
jgi:hypothetical protein